MLRVPLRRLSVRVSPDRHHVEHDGDFFVRDRAPVRFIDDEVETDVDGQDRHDDDPALDEVNEQSGYVTGKPTPCMYICIRNLYVWRQTGKLTSPDVAVTGNRVS